jgi:hypothetical protein
MFMFLSPRKEEVPDSAPTNPSRCGGAERSV